MVQNVVTRGAISDLGRPALQIGSSFEEMLEAADNFELGQGKPLQALLGSFEDLQDYQVAVKQYEESGGTETYTPPDVRADRDARFRTACMQSEGWLANTDPSDATSHVSQTNGLIWA